MPFFRSRDPLPADEGLPFLDVEEAAELRHLMRQAFGEHGLEVEMFADHLVDSEGAQFNYWNLAQHCRTEPRRRWPRITRDHVGLLLRTMSGPDPFADLTREQALAQVRCRLHELEGMVGLEKFPHRDFAPGIIEMLALDLPEAVAAFSKDSTARLGGWEALRAQGLENLRRMPLDEVIPVTGPEGSVFHVLADDDLHTGSRALVVESLMARIDDPPGPHGWLLAVPNRHQVAWHVIRDLGVLEALGGMDAFARQGHAHGSGPVSPHVYWWNGQEYEQLTHHEGDQTTVTVSERLQHTLGELSERPGHRGG